MDWLSFAAGLVTYASWFGSKRAKAGTGVIFLALAVLLAFLASPWWAIAVPVAALALWFDWKAWRKDTARRAEISRLVADFRRKHPQDFERLTKG